MNQPPVALEFRRLRPGARPPHRASALATGFDLHACLDEPGYLDVGPDPVLVPTGIAIAAAAGFDVQIRPRSGLIARGVIGSVGTVDADYRGELFITLYTVGTRGPYRVQDGDRVAQIVVGRHVEVDWLEARTLADTERGTGGHGSTGR